MSVEQSAKNRLPDYRQIRNQLSSCVWARKSDLAFHALDTAAMMEFFAPSPAPTSADDTAITPLERRVRNKASTAMVVATPVKKPYWENLDGFPNTTIQLEQRRLNPFLDINSFASKGHEYNVGARPIDTKGELGNGPVQRWKEMLREGMAYRPSKFAPTFNLKLYEGRRAQELAADGHFIKQLGHLAGGKDYSLKQGTRALTCTLSANQRHNTLFLFHCSPLSRPSCILFVCIF